MLRFVLRFCEAPGLLGALWCNFDRAKVSRVLRPWRLYKLGGWGTSRSLLWRPACGMEKQMGLEQTWSVHCII